MRCELAIPLSISEIQDFTGALNIGIAEHTLIKAICTDTREICDGDIFVALNSESDSGENYIEEAISKGVTSLSTRNTNGVLKVDNVCEALLNLASGYLGKLSNLNNIIALTGSVGKTTTKNMLKCIFATTFKTHSTRGNQNNLIGVPLTVLSAPSDTEVLICECGMNQRGEISRLSKCLSPSLSIITNVGSSHIGMLGSLEEIFKAKCEIADGMSGGYLLHPTTVLIPNYDNTLSISNSDENADLFFKIIKQDANGTLFTYRGKNIDIEMCHFHLPGAHTFNCLTYAIATADILGIGVDKIEYAIHNMPFDILRFKEYKFDTASVLDDSYNASYESIVGDLNMMRERGNPFDVVIGDILELGEYSESIHYNVGLAIANSGAKKAFLIGKYANYIRRGAQSAGMAESDVYVHYETDNLINPANDIINKHTIGATILIKASHKLGLDRLLTYFKGRL